MQDDRKQPESLDTDAKPASHDHTNRPGMNNGVPEQADQEEPKGSPSSERHETETGPGRQAGGGSDPGASSRTSR